MFSFFTNGLTTTNGQLKKLKRLERSFIFYYFVFQSTFIWTLRLSL